MWSKTEAPSQQIWVFTVASQRQLWHGSGVLLKVDPIASSPSGATWKLIKVDVGLSVCQTTEAQSKETHIYSSYTGWMSEIKVLCVGASIPLKALSEDRPCLFQCLIAPATPLAWGSKLQSLSPSLRASFPSSCGPDFSLQRCWSLDRGPP